MTDKDNIYGVMAEFKTVLGVCNAAKKIRDKGYHNWDVLTPFPIHGLDEAMGLKRSKVPFFTFIGGLSGLLLGLLIVWYMNAFDYPLIVGGKPFFSPVFPVPIYYELTILLGAFGTFFGMFITNRLPKHYHPVFNHKKFSKITDDRFWIVIEKKEPKFDMKKTRGFLEKLGGFNITPLEK